MFKEKERKGCSKDFFPRFADLSVFPTNPLSFHLLKCFQWYVFHYHFEISWVYFEDANSKHLNFEYIVRSAIVRKTLLERSI